MADSLKVTELDFDTIKENLKTFLNQQTEFTDYDFEGSGLNILLDVLAYNTHYQAYYLNMIANESFLDTALLRDSVVSQAKNLGYVPYSKKSPRALINFTVNSASPVAGSLTIPRGFRFLSNQIDGVSYGFVTLSETTVEKANSDYTFIQLPIHEGQLVNYSFGYDESSNPKQIFTIPDSDIDTTTITVTVQPLSSNTQISIYSLATDASNTQSNSEVFYLQEGKNQQYQIYFGNNVIGRKLSDGSIVNVTYLVTNGDVANKANNFIATETLTDTLGVVQTNFVINPISPASGGAEREGVDEIKFSAPLQFTTQNRLVTYKDYESYIKKNYPAVDSVSVYGGEDEIPPVYGTVFVSLKPKQNYFISDAEKQRIIDEIIKPKAIVAVNTVIRDPEFLFLLVFANVLYDPKKTTLSQEQLKLAVRNSIFAYKSEYLDKFDSTLILSKLQDDIDSVDTNSILGSEVTVRVQKRFRPTLSVSTPYTIFFNVPLHRGTISEKLISTPFNVFDSEGIIREVQFEEVPQSFSGVSSINVLNPGQNYTTNPTVTITGDGTGATAVANIVNGRLNNITVVNRGINYTRATVTISNGDGFGATAEAVIDARTGTLSTIYYDSNSQKQIVTENAGTIDYNAGVITISDIRILSVASLDGLIRMTIESEKGLISTIRNTIITLDETDPTAIITLLEQV